MLYEEESGKVLPLKERELEMKLTITTRPFLLHSTDPERESVKEGSLEGKLLLFYASGHSSK